MEENFLRLHILLGFLNAVCPEIISMIRSLVIIPYTHWKYEPSKYIKNYNVCKVRQCHEQFHLINTVINYSKYVGYNGVWAVWIIEMIYV